MEYLYEKKINLPFIIYFLLIKSCFVYLFISIYILFHKKNFKLKYLVIYTLFIQSILSYMGDVYEFFFYRENFFWGKVDIIWSIITIYISYLFLKQNNLIIKNKSIIKKSIIFSVSFWIFGLILIRLPLYNDTDQYNCFLILWAISHSLWHYIPFITSFLILNK